jgi:hypothetical protein
MTKDIKKSEEIYNVAKALMIWDHFIRQLKLTAMLWQLPSIDTALFN